MMKKQIKEYYEDIKNYAIDPIFDFQQKQNEIILQERFIKLYDHFVKGKLQDV